MCVCVCSVFVCLFVLNIFIYILYVYIIIILYVNCFGSTMLCMCIEYHIWVNKYHVNTQGIDECMVNVHYYY